MMIKLQAVIFDLDGVITGTANLHFAAWKKLTDEINVYFDRKINELLKGVDRMSSLEIILRNSEKQYTYEEKLSLTDRKNNYYRNLLETITADDILPGALNTLKLLKNLKIKTGLASASKNAFLIIDKLGISKYFDYIADASKIKKGKPDPEIFLTTADNLKVRSEECMGVEDSEAGIKAIKAACMYALGIGDSNILKDADYVIRSLEDFNINKLILL
ncbi:MAG TPA: beta-phosphoglucomutase [Clostridiales bacterium]|nr:beta-phosphoglucomutase [Clostridiales bacterium]